MGWLSVSSSNLEDEIRLIFKKTLNEQVKNPRRVLNMEKINLIRKIESNLIKQRINDRFLFFKKSLK